MRKSIAAMPLAVLLSACLSTFALAANSAPVYAAPLEQSETLTNQTQVVYDSQSGLPTSEANTVCQTKDGYIWIGSYGGLLRYDGVRFTNFSKEKNGIDSAGIRALFEDKNGVLWIGTNDNGIYSYSAGKFEHYSSGDRNFSSVRCFTQTADGTLYVGTAIGLAVLKDNTLVSARVPSLENQTIYTLSTDENDAVWGTAGAGYAFAVRNTKLEYWFAAGTLSRHENYSALADGNKIYIGTSSNVILRLTFSDAKYNASSYKKESFNTGERHTLNSIYKTAGGNIWLGTDGGPAYFDSNMKFHPAKSLSGDTFITGIHEDYEGNIWLASTKHGVFQIAYGKFYEANEQAGLEGQSINAVCRLGGKTYTGSDSGLTILDGNWTPMENALTRQLKGIRTRSLSKDKNGNLWISTYGDYGLIRYTPTTGEILSITQEDGLSCNRVRTALPLSDGRIAVATTEGLSIIKDAEVVEAYSPFYELANGTILSLLETDDGTLLAGSDGDGIYAIKNGKVEHIGTDKGLHSGVVLRMAKDDEAGGIWISAGSGLYFMKDEKITEITAFKAGTGSVFDIIVMDDDIWLLKGSGIFVVPREELLQQKISAPIKEYGMESGLTGDITANSWNCMESGVLYLCTGNGVSLIDKNNVPDNKMPPKTAINLVTVTHENGEETEYRGVDSIALESSDKRLSIQFAALSYAIAPCMVEYKMEGFDKEKTLTSIKDMNMASYTNLKGGKYTFCLSAINADGVSGEIGQTLSITKEKGFFEHQSVWIIMAILIILFGVLATRIVMGFKLKQLQRRQQEYKAITDQALQTIANTIDAKDEYTNGHSVRVAGYSRELARRLGLSADEQEQIYYIALLHDIGKIGIPDAILNKPGKLTEKEFDVMRSHTTIGANILKDFTAVPHIGDGAAGHHENYDGTGYPEKKTAEELPLVAKIIRVADAYDAMSTKRAYRDPMSKEYILSEFIKYRGIEFDPKIEELMIKMIESGYNANS